MAAEGTSDQRDIQCLKVAKQAIITVGETLKETESEFLEGESLDLAVTFDMAFEMPFPTIE